MPHLNVEIKARTHRLDDQWRQLLALGATDCGIDHQTDTYFEVPHGRLKLREGNIENSLIFYHRPNEQGPKPSEVHLAQLSPENNLKDVLNAALGAKVQVRKARRILWIQNVKFHLDEVEGLGAFVEIEAIDQVGKLGKNLLQQQCTHYMRVLGILDSELEAQSYSDLLLKVRG